MRINSGKMPSLRYKLIFALALIGLYLLTYRGPRSSVIDEAMMLEVSSQLVDHQTITLNTVYQPLTAWGAPQADLTKPVYSKYALGQSLLGLPFYALSRLLPVNSFLPTPEGSILAPNGSAGLVFLAGILVTVLSVVGVYRVLLQFDFQPDTAALISAVYAATTLAWPYSKTFFNEPSTSCAAVWLLYFAIRYRYRKRTFDGLMTGVCLGLAILFRTSSLILVPLVAFYLWPRLVILIPGVIAGIGLTLGYNALRYGSILVTGYEQGFGNPPWEALLGYFISPSRSLFLFNPILLLAVPGAFFLWRKRRADVLFIASLTLSLLLLYATWYDWGGGGSLGPRFLLPVIPLLIILSAAVLLRGKAWQLIFGVLTGLGFLVQVLANLVAPGWFFQDAAYVLKATPDQVNWNLGDSILVNLWPSYLRHHIDSYFLLELNADPIIKTILFFIIATLLFMTLVWSARHVGSNISADREFKSGQPKNG